MQPDLAGRQARCSCGTIQSSNAELLAFFEYWGQGSRRATEICKCGLSYSAHTTEGMAQNVPSNRKTVVEQGKCSGFEARGPEEFDYFYCGCRGWD